MKTRFVFACAVAAIALTAFGGATASADDENYGTLEISPNVVRAGAEVTLSATCWDPEFTAPAYIESPALEATPLTGTKDSEGVWQLSGTATVRDVTGGNWSGMFQCGPGGHVVVGNFTVEGPSPEPKPEVAVKPAQGPPGAKVDLLVFCANEVLKVESKALTIGKYEKLPAKEGESVPWLRAASTVNDVKPGAYDVNVTCGKTPVSTTFTVLAKDAPAPAPKAQVPVKPKGAADTGSLDAAPAPADDTNLYVLGGAALAVLIAAGGAGTLIYRKRQRV